MRRAAVASPMWYASATLSHRETTPTARGKFPVSGTIENAVPGSTGIGEITPSPLVLASTSDTYVRLPAPTVLENTAMACPLSFARGVVRRSAAGVPR